MKKGITPVIAVVLLLMITISMVGFAFVWFGDLFKTVTTDIGNQTGTQLSQQGQKVRVDNVAEGATANVTIRAVGTVAVPVNSISVYVGGIPVTNCGWGGSIATGSVETCETGLSCTDGSGTVIRVTSPGTTEGSTWTC